MGDLYGDLYGDLRNAEDRWLNPPAEYSCPKPDCGADIPDPDCALCDGSGLVGTYTMDIWGGKNDGEAVSRD